MWEFRKEVDMKKVTTLTGCFSFESFQSWDFLIPSRSLTARPFSKLPSAPIGKDRLPFPSFFRGELLNFRGVFHTDPFFLPRLSKSWKLSFKRRRRPNVPCNTCANNVMNCEVNCKAERGNGGKKRVNWGVNVAKWVWLGGFDITKCCGLMLILLIQREGVNKNSS